MATGGPGQGASPTTCTEINVAGVQGSVGDPHLPLPIGLPPVGVQSIAPGTGLVTAPGAYNPAGMPPALAGTGVIPGARIPTGGNGYRRNGWPQTGGTTPHGGADGSARGIFRHQDLP